MQEQRGGGSPRMNNTRRWLATGAMRQWPGVDGVRIHGSAGHGACVWRECGVGLGAVAGRFRPRPRGAGRGAPHLGRPPPRDAPPRQCRGGLWRLASRQRPQPDAKRTTKGVAWMIGGRRGSGGNWRPFSCTTTPNPTLFIKLIVFLRNIKHSEESTIDRGEFLNRRK